MHVITELLGLQLQILGIASDAGVTNFHVFLCPII